MLIELGIILGVFFSSVFITGAMRRYAIKKNILDIPNLRSSHKIPTPRGGGLSIVLTFSIFLFVLWSLGKIGLDNFMALFCGGILVALIGFWDDHKHIPATWRIVVHFIAAIWALFWLGDAEFQYSQDGMLHLGWIIDIAALFLLVWLLNLYNFMDGIDGIAGLQAIFVVAAAALFILLGDSSTQQDILLGDDENQNIVYLLIALATAVLGFLVWNWPPAKIFMGDVGSGYLGYILAVIAISSAINNILSLWVWLILLGIFLVDATVTLIRRLITGQRWYDAHRCHAYQNAVQQFGSHRVVTVSVLVINIVWLLPMAWYATIKPEWGAELTLGAYLPLLLLALYLRAGKAQ